MSDPISPRRSSSSQCLLNEIKYFRASGNQEEDELDIGSTTESSAQQMSNPDQSSGNVGETENKQIPENVDSRTFVEDQYSSTAAEQTHNNLEEFAITMSGLRTPISSSNSFLSQSSDGLVGEFLNTFKINDCDEVVDFFNALSTGNHKMDEFDIASTNVSWEQEMTDPVPTSSNISGAENHQILENVNQGLDVSQNETEKHQDVLHQSLLKENENCQDLENQMVIAENENEFDTTQTEEFDKSDKPHESETLSQKINEIIFKSLADVCKPIANHNEVENYQELLEQDLNLCNDQTLAMSVEGVVESSMSTANDQILSKSEEEKIQQSDIFSKSQCLDEIKEASDSLIHKESEDCLNSKLVNELNLIGTLTVAGNQEFLDETAVEKNQSRSNNSSECVRPLVRDSSNNPNLLESTEEEKEIRANHRQAENGIVTENHRQAENQRLAEYQQQTENQESMEDDSEDDIPIAQLICKKSNSQVSLSYSPEVTESSNFLDESSYNQSILDEDCGDLIFANLERKRLIANEVSEESFTSTPEKVGTTSENIEENSGKTSTIVSVTQMYLDKAAKAASLPSFDQFSKDPQATNTNSIVTSTKKIPTNSPVSTETQKLLEEFNIRKCSVVLKKLNHSLWTADGECLKLFETVAPKPRLLETADAEKSEGHLEIDNQIPDHEDFENGEIYEIPSADTAMAISTTNSSGAAENQKLLEEFKIRKCSVVLKKLNHSLWAADGECLKLFETVSPKPRLLETADAEKPENRSEIDNQRPDHEDFENGEVYEIPSDTDEIPKSLENSQTKLNEAADVNVIILDDFVVSPPYDEFSKDPANSNLIASSTTNSSVAAENQKLIEKLRLRGCSVVVKKLKRAADEKSQELFETPPKKSRLMENSAAEKIQDISRPTYKGKPANKPIPSTFVRKINAVSSIQNKTANIRRSLRKINEDPDVQIIEDEPEILPTFKRIAKGSHTTISKMVAFSANSSPANSSVPAKNAKKCDSSIAKKPVVKVSKRRSPVKPCNGNIDEEIVIAKRMKTTHWDDSDEEPLVVTKKLKLTEWDDSDDESLEKQIQHSSDLQNTLNIPPADSGKLDTVLTNQGNSSKDSAVHLDNLESKAKEDTKHAMASSETNEENLIEGVSNKEKLIQVPVGAVSVDIGDKSSVLDELGNVLKPVDSNVPEKLVKISKISKSAKTLGLRRVTRLNSVSQKLGRRTVSTAERLI